MQGAILSKAEPDTVVERRKIRGNVAKGRRPHVWIDGVQYTNESLSKMSSTIGSELLLWINENDMRSVHAQVVSGEELGALTARGQWSRVIHSRTMRKAINSILARPVITELPAHDPVNVLLQHLRTRERGLQTPLRKHILF